MEKILISVGIVLSLGGVWFMIRSKLYRTSDGLADIVGGPIKKWLYRLGWIALIVGVIAQIVGIWFPQIFQGISSAFANPPIVKNLPEAGENSLLEKILDDPSLIIALFVLIATIAIAIASVLSVRVTKRTTQAQLYARLFEEYASSEMTSALRMLKGAQDNILAIEKKRGIEVENYETVLADPDIVKGAQRRVKYYFFKALRLHKLCFLPEKLLQEVGSVAGINILYDFVERFEKDQKAKSEIEEIRKICGRYEYEEDISITPPTN